MNLNQWAIKWGVPFAAVEDLRREFGAISTDPAESHDPPESEAAVQTRVRLEASQKGARVWRNNVGATYTEEGSFVRYGLCNDSTQMNGKLKSSDLVGIKPVLIQPYHVGQVIGQFLARECKPEAWTYTGTDREVAQLRFLELVAGLGGDAVFANREGTI